MKCICFHIANRSKNVIVQMAWIKKYIKKYYVFYDKSHIFSNRHLQIYQALLMSVNHDSNPQTQPLTKFILTPYLLLWYVCLT